MSLTTGMHRPGTRTETGRKTRRNEHAAGAARARLKAGRARRGALLLESVVALAIMVAAMGLLGAQLVNGMKLINFTERQTRVSQLLDRLLALLELDQQEQQRVFVDQQMDGDFGKQNPGYSWRMSIEPAERDQTGLNRIIIQILYQPDSSRPDSKDGAEVVRTVALLKADPGRIDLAADFGVDDETLTSLSESVPIPNFDPHALNPQDLVSLDPQTLLAILPQIMPLLQQALGVNLPSDLSADQLGQLLQGMQGGDVPPDLIDQLQKAAGELGGGGGIPGGGIPGGGAGTPGGGNFPVGDPRRGMTDMGGTRGGTGGAGPRPNRGGGINDDGDGAQAPTGNGAGGAGTRGGGGNRGGAGGARNGGRAANGGGLTIDDLMRLRDAQNGAMPQSRGGGQGKRP